MREHTDGIRRKPLCGAGFSTATFKNKGLLRMDIDVFSELIGTMGFPIACVIAIFYMWNKEREEHRAEIDKWVDAFNKNTAAFHDLKEIMEIVKEGMKNDKQ